MSKAPREPLRRYQRDQILSPVWDVIRKNGFAQSSLDPIIKQAGLRRRIVSEHIASKSAILGGCRAISRETLAEEPAARVGAGLT
jgi:hypothetical protein